MAIGSLFAMHEHLRKKTKRKAVQSKKKVIINGGFPSNQHFIELLKIKFPDHTFEVSDRPEGSAYRAALIMRDS